MSRSGAEGIRRLLLALLALLAAATPAAAARPRGFTIERFVVSLHVNPDASLIVREDITFDFRGAHNGIFRTIPIRYERGGLEFDLRVDGVGAYDEQSRPLQTEVTYPGRYVRIKTWVPGAVDTRKTVTVVYRVRRGLLAFDDHDELYWNVTGNEWDVPISVAEAYVDLPASAGADLARSIAYTGGLGAAGQDYAVERVDTYLRFRTTRVLRPREGLTIVVGWPVGHVARPSRLQQAEWAVADNWPLGLPAVFLALGGFVWWTFGRDPASNRSIKVEYEPPPGLLPAEAGALLSEKAHPRDVTATIVDLAVRGYLKIERITTAFDETDYMFKRLRTMAGNADLKPLELFVLARIFGEDWGLNMRLLSEVRRDYNNVFPPIRDAVFRSLVEERLFPASPRKVRLFWAAVGAAIIALAFVAPAYGSGWLGLYGWELPAGLVASGLVIVFFSRIMPRRTWRGVQVLAQVRGFQEFLERAEKDQLERMPGDTFHRWLPWALALGVVSRWVNGFKDLPVAAPAWYSSDRPFSVLTFESDLDTFSRRTEEAITTSRRSVGSGSGDGGGGFSGDSGFSSGSSGGGGGGGGGGTF